MNRREFLQAVPLGVGAVWVTTQPDGGVVVPCPDDLRAHMEFFGPYFPAESNTKLYHTITTVVYWPMSTSRPTLQLYHGLLTMPATEDPLVLAQRQHEMFEELRAIWAEDHRPGWLRVAGSVRDRGDDQDRHWTRVSQIRWLTCREYLDEPRGEVTTREAPATVAGCEACDRNRYHPVRVVTDDVTIWCSPAIRPQ